MGWIRKRGESVGGPSEDMGHSSIREVGTAQDGIEVGSTDAAEAAIRHHVVSSLSIFVRVERRPSICVLMAFLR